MGLLNGSTVLVTGGTGSFGKSFVRTILNNSDVKKVIIFSRDELKQYEMEQEYENEDRIRFFIGDVRDLERLHRAFDGVDYVVHAAAMKQVPAAEYNPFEAVKTNIHGAQNVINAAITQGVKSVIALSTDKASSPVNLYGATKLVSDKLFVTGNVYAGSKSTRFAVVRYGNVLGSRGSVIPLFKQQAKKGTLSITDERMTRFWINLEEGIQFVLDSFERMHGGEIFVPKIPSMKVVDLARVIAPDAKMRMVGIRPGEKLHEEMISTDDARRTLDMGSYFVICPETTEWLQKEGGRLVEEGFHYSSESNDDWLDIESIKKIVAKFENQNRSH